MIQPLERTQKSYGRHATKPRSMRELNGFIRANVCSKWMSPSCPPNHWSSVTEPSVCRMISAAAIVTMAR